MSLPLVSVIMPAYNAEKTIAESIRSVISQTFIYWELLIIDDGSTDKTKQIANSYLLSDPRISLIVLEKNQGLSNARNEGILRATGSWIAFLDSDDIWHSEKLSIQVTFHQENPSTLISHTDFKAFDENGIKSRPFKSLLEPIRSKKGILFPGICYKNPIGVLTVVVSRQLLVEVGLFDTNLWGLEDRDLWVRIARRNCYFGYIDKTLAFYRTTSGGMTNKTGKYKRAYKAFLKKTSFPGININLLFQDYYRHFGTVYFKKNKWTLSKLYFSKAIRLGSINILSISTVVYLMLAQFFFLKEKCLKTK